MVWKKQMALCLILLVPSACRKPSELPPQPGWIEDAVLYEINTRQFTPEGTFSAIAGHLPRLKRLGVDLLWFMPVHPIGRQQRKGTLGSPYSVRDYRAVNPDYGTAEEFAELVARAHQAGMRVIIDWVANHTAWDHDWMSRCPHFYSRDSTGAVTAPVADWFDVADLNYETAVVSDSMIETMKWWVREMDIDGFRCDVAEMVPMSFWRHATRELSRIKPLFFLAEGEAPELHDNGFHMTYASRMHHLFNRIGAGTAQADDILSLLDEEREAYPAGALRMRFTSNHDENFWKGPAIERLGVEGAKAFAVLTFTLPGHALIYNGQEIGLEKRLPFFEKDSIEWRESEFEPLYQRCIQLYKRHPALRRGRLVPLTGAPLLAFIMERGRDRVIALFNLTPGRVQTQIKLEGVSGHFIEAFRATRLSVDDSELHFELPPWAYRIYISEATVRALGRDSDA